MSFQWFSMIFESSSLNPGQFVTYESLSDRKLENFESKDFETLSSNQFSKINITRECSIWKHSRHLQIPVFIGHTFSPVPSELGPWRTLSLSHWVWMVMLTCKLYILNLHILLLKVRESTFLKINLEPVESLGICWISFSKPRWLQFNLCQSHWNLMPQSVLDGLSVTDRHERKKSSLKIKPQLISMKISQMRLN